MADKPVPNPQRLKRWPRSVLPKDQDKAAETGTRHVPVAGEPVEPAEAPAVEAVVQDVRT